MVQINDPVTPCPIYKYVDDSTIFEIMSPGAISHLYDSVSIAVLWTKDNDMRINASKTQEMVICLRRGQTHHNKELPNIIIDDDNIKRVKHTKA